VITSRPISLIDPSRASLFFLWYLCFRSIY